MSQTSSATALKNVLKETMFAADETPVVICEDKSRFKKVMTAFSDFEKEVYALCL